MRKKYYNYRRKRFSGPTRIMMGLLINIIILVPMNTVNLQHTENLFYRQSRSIYEKAIEYPQKLIDTYIQQELDIQFPDFSHDPGRFLQKQRYHIWLIKKWFFWGTIFILLIPLTLMFSIGSIRKVGVIFSRSRLKKSYNGSLLWEIKDKVHKVRWRVNFFKWENGVVHIIIVGSFLFLAQFGTQCFLHISQEMMQSLLLSFLIYTTGLYIFYLYYNRFSEKRVIGIIDTRMGLKERLVTAMEKPDTQLSLYTMLLEETSQRLRRQDVKTLAPHRFPRPDRKKLAGATLFIISLALLIFVAAPHAAFLTQSYNGKVNGLLSQEEEAADIELESLIQVEGERLKELVEELERESEDADFVLDEARRLAVKMISFNAEMFDSAPRKSRSPKPDSPSADTPSGKGSKKEISSPEKGKPGPDTGVKSNGSSGQGTPDSHQVPEKMAELAMKMNQNFSLQNSPPSQRNGSLRNTSVRLFSQTGEIYKYDLPGDPVNGDKSEKAADWKNQGHIFYKQQDNENQSAPIPVNLSSQTEKEDNFLPDQQLDTQFLKNLLEGIFSQNEDVPPSGEDMQIWDLFPGEQEDTNRKDVVSQENNNPGAEDDSVSNLLNKMLSLPDRGHTGEKREQPPADSPGRSKRNIEGETIVTRSQKQKRAPDSGKSPNSYNASKKRKNLVVVNNPGNFIIGGEGIGTVPEEYADLYVEDWIDQSESVPREPDDSSAGKVEEKKLLCGSRIDILAKNQVVVKNPFNIANPRREMRNAVVAVENPDLIQNVPQELSRFVGNVDTPKKIEAFAPRLSKLDKDLKGWERLNTLRTGRIRAGMGRQRMINPGGEWIDNEVEIGGQNPQSGLNSGVIRGGRTDDDPNGENQKLRTDASPRHSTTHPELTNISADLDNLGRDADKTQTGQRNALLGRLEKSGISPNAIKENAGKMSQRQGDRNERISENTGQANNQANPISEAQAEKTAGNQYGQADAIFQGRPGNNNPGGGKTAQNVLRENQKRGFMQNSGNLADRPSSSNLKNSAMNSMKGSALLQKADSYKKPVDRYKKPVDRIAEDNSSQTTPKGNKDMARRFSQIAKSAKNLDLGMEKGKSIGRRGELDTIRKTLRQKGRRVEFLSQELKRNKKPRGIKEMASELAGAVDEITNLREGLGNYADSDRPAGDILQKINKIKEINWKIQKETDPKRIQEMSAKMIKLAQGIKITAKAQSDSPPDSFGGENRQDSPKQAGSASGKPASARDGVKKLHQLAGRVGDLMKDMRQAADNRKPRISDVLDAVQKAMLNTMEKMRNTIKTANASHNSGRMRSKGKEMAGLVRRMEKLSRLQSRLGGDSAINRKQQEALKTIRGQLKELSKRLLTQTDLDRLRNLSQKAFKTSKKLVALTQKDSTPGSGNSPRRADKLTGLSRRLKKITKLMKKNNNPEATGDISKELKDIIQQLRRQNKRLFQQTAPGTPSSGSSNSLSPKIDAPGQLKNELVRKAVRHTRKSLQEITERLQRGFDVKKSAANLKDISRKLANLSHNLSGITKGKVKKGGLKNRITPAEKKVVKNTADKLKKIARKAEAAGNPPDIRRVAADLNKLMGNLNNFPIGKDKRERKDLAGLFPGQDRSLPGRKLGPFSEILNKIRNSKKLNKFSSYFSQLAAKMAGQTPGQGDKKNAIQQQEFGGTFGKIMGMIRVLSKDKDLMEKMGKSRRNKNALSKTAALGMIDKAIKKLKRGKKNLTGAYNSKRILKSSGGRSKGTGSIPKGSFLKMTQSSQNGAKFTDTNVSKDLNVIPNTDIINNTYSLEKNLTDKQVFQRIIKRLENNRQRILAQGRDPRQVMPSGKLPLSSNNQPRPRISSKQPVEGDTNRMTAGLGIPDTVTIPENPLSTERPQHIPGRSHMNTPDFQQYSKMPVRVNKKNSPNLATDYKLTVPVKKFQQLNSLQERDNSIIDQEIPKEYRDIIKQLFHRT